MSTSDENRYCANVKNSSTQYQEDIVSLMLDKSTTVTMNASSPLKKELAFRARVERDSQDLAQPQIKQVYSFATDSLTTEFAPGALIELKGEYLKDEEKQTRIYLRQEGADERRSLETVHRISDRNILCNLPEDLTPGAYWISATVGDGDGDPRCMYSEPVNIS